jgi:hypothetical protein
MKILIILAIILLLLVAILCKAVKNAPVIKDENMEL